MSQIGYLSTQKGVDLAAFVIVPRKVISAQPLLLPLLVEQLSHLRDPKKWLSFSNAWRKTTIYLKISVFVFLEPIILPGLI